MNFYTKSLEEFSTDYYAAITTGIFVSSCLGAVAAMLVLMSGNGILEMFELGLLVMVCMWYNATVMAQLKVKKVFDSLIFSLVVSFVLIVVNLVLLT